MRSRDPFPIEPHAFYVLSDSFLVMAGFDPAIHAFLAQGEQGQWSSDGWRRRASRFLAGHDEVTSQAVPVGSFSEALNRLAPRCVSLYLSAHSVGLGFTKFGPRRHRARRCFFSAAPPPPIAKQSQDQIVGSWNFVVAEVTRPTEEVVFRSARRPKAS